MGVTMSGLTNAAGAAAAAAARSQPAINAQLAAQGLPQVAVTRAAMVTAPATASSSSLGPGRNSSSTVSAASRPAAAGGGGGRCALVITVLLFGPLLLLPPAASCSPSGSLRVPHSESLPPPSPPPSLPLPPSSLSLASRWSNTGHPSTNNGAKHAALFKTLLGGFAKLKAMIPGVRESPQPSLSP